jgi:hypothetical protein
MRLSGFSRQFLRLSFVLFRTIISRKTNCLLIRFLCAKGLLRLIRRFCLSRYICLFHRGFPCTGAAVVKSGGTDFGEPFIHVLRRYAIQQDGGQFARHTGRESFYRLKDYLLNDFLCKGFSILNKEGGFHGKGVQVHAVVQ